MRDHLPLLALALAASVAGNALYRQLARRFGIVAHPNERSLHEGAIPRGGGVVVVLVFLAGMVALFAAGELPQRWYVALVGGGAIVGLVGFIDDVTELSTRARVVTHFVAALWATSWVGGDFEITLGATTIDLSWPGYGVTVLAVMWMINLFNFMDGIDGMETSGVVWFSIAALAILEWQGGSPLSVPLALLALASAGFLVFNWPPARLFLGDAGSGFYGYAFSVFVLVTVASGKMSVWTWVILLGYFIGDTTTTLAIRLRRVKKWWGTHRSHAYQNLARVWRNHRRVTLLVLAVEVVWLTPLAAASVEWPELGPLLALVALAPVVGLAIKYGPLHER
jgi:Fuc2NAc and GlcNAc transferase